MKKISVWREADLEDVEYVPRCSFCGRYKGTLSIHWFFTGMYCADCIEENLYGGFRSLREM